MLKISKKILWMYAIKDMQNEPHHQHQNYTRQHVQEIKSISLTIMDSVIARKCLWYLFMKYVTYLLNHVTNPKLDNNTPIEKVSDVTLNMSAINQSYFYQPVMYLKTNMSSFPSSKELIG